MHIHYPSLAEQLRITQSYCDEQLNTFEKNLAAILRSINPVIGGKPLFSFQPEMKGSYLSTDRFQFYAQINSKYQYDDQLSSLFDFQLKYKKELPRNPNRDYMGKISICYVDHTTHDGVSEVESLGFYDKHDCPPIDTWFGLSYDAKWRSNVLFSWTPEPFIDLVNQGILVSAIENITWLADAYPTINEQLKQLVPHRMLT